MKDRLVKLKARRGKVSLDFSTCKKCGKDYNEKENFNWSCRTHKSQWSGEMWWCCGKRTKEAAGCLISKHELRRDDEDETEAKEDSLSLMRCVCCKDKGHSIENCPRDPNLKTNEDPKEEILRLQNTKDFRLVFAETVQQTT